jgi:hypothetical protein
VFGLLCGAAGIGYADVRRNQDVRGARISVRRDARLVEELLRGFSPEDFTATLFVVGEVDSRVATSVESPLFTPGTPFEQFK